MNCPHCKEDGLMTTTYECVEVEQCRTCHGVWLDAGEIELIINDRTTKFSEQEVKSTLKLAFPGIPKSEAKHHRLCPKCGDRLKAVNYTGDSGVVVDVCPHEHGLWFDRNELERVQHFREYWKDNIEKSGLNPSNLIEDEDLKEDQVPSRSLLFNIASYIGDKLS